MGTRGKGRVGVMEARRVTGVVGDDRPSHRTAVLAALREADVAVAAEATTGRTLVASCLPLRPDLVVLDLAIAGELGGALIPQLLSGCPVATLIVFSPLITADGVDLSRVRVVDPNDPRQLRRVAGEVVELNRIAVRKASSPLHRSGG